MGKAPASRPHRLIRSRGTETRSSPPIATSESGACSTSCKRRSRIFPRDRRLKPQVEPFFSLLFEPRREGVPPLDRGSSRCPTSSRLARGFSAIPRELTARSSCPRFHWGSRDRPGDSPDGRSPACPLDSIPVRLLRHSIQGTTRHDCAPDRSPGDEFGLPLADLPARHQRHAAAVGRGRARAGRAGGDGGPATPATTWSRPTCGWS